MPERKIIHVDMDAFFASVEIRDNPSLKGKPVIIGAKPQERGVVSTCSYEARKFGVKSAMSIKMAYKLCPQGVYMHPDIRKYEKVSEELRKIFYRYSFKIEPASLDEAYLDVSQTADLFSGEYNAALKIKNDIKNELCLSASVGIGYNMLTAKLASEEKKPDGLFWIKNQTEFSNIFMNRSIGCLYGIGKVTVKLLESYGIYLISDLQSSTIEFLTSVLGSRGEEIYLACRGIDEREVTPSYQSKSEGREITFQYDTRDFKLINDTIINIIKELAFNLNEQKLWCRTLTLKIKYKDMHTITRAKTLDNPTNSSKEIYESIIRLYNSAPKNQPIRLIGVSLSHFCDSPSIQLSFSDINHSQKDEKFNRLVHELKKKYGQEVIKDPLDFKRYGGTV